MHNKYGKFGFFNADESAFALIKFKNGSTLSLEVSYLLNSINNSFGCNLFGTKGSLNWPKVELVTQKKSKMIKKYFPDPDSKKASFIQLLHFVDCIINNKQPIVKLDESLILIKMIEAIHKSSKDNKEIIF